MRNYIAAMVLAWFCTVAVADDTTPATENGNNADCETLRLKVQELQSQVDLLKAKLAEAEKTIAALNAKLATGEGKTKTTDAKPDDKPVMKLPEFLAEARKAHDKMPDETTAAYEARRAQILASLAGRRLELTGTLTDIVNRNGQTRAEIIHQSKKTITMYETLASDDPSR